MPSRAILVSAVGLLAFRAAGAGAPGGRPYLVSDKTQLPVVTVAEVATTVEPAAAQAFREYVGRERPSYASAFECFKLVPAKNMREAEQTAVQKGAPFILRVQLLRRVFTRKWKDANTGKMVDDHRSDAKLELWAPNTSKGAPKGSWKKKSSCVVRNYNPKSPGMVLMDAGCLDDTDGPDTPWDFGPIGGGILRYLQRSVLEVKKVTIEYAADGGASAHVEFVNHANIPLQVFMLSPGSGLCGVYYGLVDTERRPLPPGEHEATVLIRAGVDEKLPPEGPCKGRITYLSFGEADRILTEEEAAAMRRKRP